jgi:para-nitrobenzyl esterase
MPRLLILLPLLQVALPLSAAISDPVRVEQGLLSGTVNGKVSAYKGVPFAAPPVGDLRWRAPQPPAAWKGVRAADKFSSTCMQTPYPEGSLYRSTPEPVSEDCLYLNIWTAASSASDKRPVMLWIHGGAFVKGSGSTPTYDGSALALKGAVVVTINYRLGIFGFFAHPELTAESASHASGNYAILDQIAALKWVQKNIAAFGGDPSRVTIFGESAGSWAVNALVASPLAKGLFHRAIGESGANFGPIPRMSDAENAGAKAGSVADLRAKSAEDVLKLPWAIALTIDGYVEPEPVRTIFEKGHQNDVPILIGSNADEGTAFMPAKMGVAAYEAYVRGRLGVYADDFLKLSPASTDEEAWRAGANVIRDQVFGVQMRMWARLQAKTGKAPAYLYYFSRVPTGGALAKRYGAFHASEISYVFGTGDIGRRRWTDDDQKLSDVMSSYWFNFAATGNPNGPGLPVWPQYDEKKDLALGLGDKVEAIPVPHKAVLDVLTNMLIGSK